MEDKFRVIIAGGRDFDDFRALSEFCMYVLQNKQNVEVVSGKANGADKLGEQFARFMGYPIKEFPANWDDIEDKPESQIGYNKSGKPYWKIAGMVRNNDMAEYADALIAFWDGESKGTANMIDLAKKMNLKVRIYKYEQPIKEEDIPWWKQ